MIRGIAILLICVVNVPEGMGSTLLTHLGNVRLSGWNVADAATWWTLHTFVEGTQRGLLQLLIGGSLVLLADGARRDGGRPTATLAARYGSLALFGLFDIAAIGWYGDILLEYSVAALIAAPLRRFPARLLLLVGIAYAVGTLALGLFVISEARGGPHGPGAAHGATPHHASAPKAFAVPHVTSASLRTDPDVSPFIAEESAAHLGGPLKYVPWAVRFWRMLVLPNLFLGSVLASICTILIGIALFRLRFLQGGWSTRAYLVTLISGMVLGLAIRIPGSDAVLHGTPTPPLSAAAGEIGRLAMTMAYASGVILLLRTRMRVAVLPLAAPGRVAFSIYLLQNLTFLFIVFNGGGFALFGRYSWFGLTMIALVSLPLQIVLARLWLSRFALGPLEWAWRSLARRRLLPIVHQSVAEEIRPDGRPA